MFSKNKQAKYWSGKEIPQIEAYWSSPPGIKRSQFFVEQLKDYTFDSIFEVGYFSGRNLKYIQKAFPNVKIDGLELNAKAAKFARKHLNLPHLKCMNAYDINTIKEKYDIVFTSGVLIHIVPTDVEQIINKMMNISNKYIVHMEELGSSQIVACPHAKLKPLKKVSDQWQWTVNLIPIYEKLGKEYEILELPEEVKTNGAKELLIVRL